MHGENFWLAEAFANDLFMGIDQQAASVEMHCLHEARRNTLALAVGGDVMRLTVSPSRRRLGANSISVLVYRLENYDGNQQIEVPFLIGEDESHLKFHLSETDTGKHNVLSPFGGAPVLTNEFDTHEAGSLILELLEEASLRSQAKNSRKSPSTYYSRETMAISRTGNRRAS